MQTANSIVSVDGSGLDDGLAAFAQAHVLLSEEIDGRSVAIRAGLDCGQSARHADQRSGCLALERPDRCVCLLLGEFNSGKSTLLNSLIGRRVAATDAFEMTHAVCRVVSSLDGPDRVLLSRPGGSAGRELPLADFLMLSQARQLGDYTQARAWVRGVLDIEFVDTPGIGANQEHEIEALDAVSHADCVVYCIDVTNLGGARDVAAVRRLIELRLPFVCVLTKCDLLDTDEVNATIDYVSDDLGVPGDAVFAVAAASDLPEWSDRLAALRSHLTSSVSGDVVAVRRQALLAQARDVGDEYRQCLVEVERSVRASLDRASEYRHAMLRTADAVTQNMLRRMGDMLWDKLRLCLERRPLDGSSLSAEDFSAVYDEVVRRDNHFAQAIESQVEADFQRDWVGGMMASADRMATNLNQARAEADREATLMYEHLLSQEQMKQAAAQSAVTSATIGLASMILFGPVGLIAAIPTAFRAWTMSQQAGPQTADANAQSIIQSMEAWRENTVGQALRALSPDLSNRNRLVALKAADGYASSQPDWPLDVAGLESLANRCADLITRLSALGT